MNHNSNKYYVEDSGLLTEAEKIEMARSLRELERQGVIEYRDGCWTLITEVPSGLAAHVSNKPEGKNCEYELHFCSSSDCEMHEPCDRAAAGSYRGRWYCPEHLNEMTDANKETDAERAGGQRAEAVDESKMVLDLEMPRNPDPPACERIRTRLQDAGLS